MGTAVKTEKKKGYELDADALRIKERIERALVDSEGEITPEIEEMISSLENLEGDIEDKIKAYQFVFQSVNVEKVSAGSRKGYYDELKAKYGKTEKALEEAGKRIRFNAARLLRHLPDGVRIDGRKVYRRLFHSVEVVSEEAAAKALFDTRAVKSVAEVDRHVWDNLVLKALSAAASTGGDVGNLAKLALRRLEDEPAFVKHSFDKKAITDMIDFAAYEAEEQVRVENLRMADRLLEVYDEEGAQPYLARAEQASEKIAEILPAGISVSVTETVMGF